MVVCWRLSKETKWTRWINGMLSRQCRSWIWYAILSKPWQRNFSSTFLRFSGQKTRWWLRRITAVITHFFCVLFCFLKLFEYRFWLYTVFGSFSCHLNMARYMHFIKTDPTLYYMMYWVDLSLKDYFHLTFQSLFKFTWQLLS